MFPELLDLEIFNEVASIRVIEMRDKKYKSLVYWHQYFFGGKYDLIQLHRQIIHQNDWIFESARANWNITVCYGTPCTTFGEILIKPISASTEAKSSKILVNSIKLSIKTISALLSALLKVGAFFRQKGNRCKSSCTRGNTILSG